VPPERFFCWACLFFFAQSNDVGIEGGPQERKTDRLIHTFDIIVLYILSIKEW
jgi:hypothetical protein